MNLRHETCFSELASHLVRISRTCALFYVANPGNWGDALIAAGTRQFLNHYRIPNINLPFRLCRSLPKTAFRLLSRRRRSVLLYGGGGSLTRHYRRPGKLKRLAAKFDGLFLLPSTICLDLAAEPIHPNTTAFRRDRFQSAAYCPGSSFCHDLAFFLQMPPVPIGREEACFFREDAEAPDTITPENNLDLSALGTHKSSPDAFVRSIGRYRTIHTNRLHVGIASAMLGRETHLYPNDYFKIQAVFRSSLEDFFPNVTFHDSCSPHLGGMQVPTVTRCAGSWTPNSKRG